MNAVNWFEIPVRDLARAQRFYEIVLGTPMRREAMGPQQMAVFAYAPEAGVGGCLVHEEGAVPAAVGSLVYLNAGPALDPVLARAAAAGGRIATPKTALPEGMGFWAHIDDCEGNRVGLHAMA